MQTSSPRLRCRSARCDPMKPAPPVMSTFIVALRLMSLSQRRNVCDLRPSTGGSQARIIAGLQGQLHRLMADRETDLLIIGAGVPVSVNPSHFQGRGVPDVAGDAD